MGDHQNDHFITGLPSTNGHNGHFGGLPAFGGSDSCNGSKTQSTTTTESNTPENTVRLDAIDGDVNHKSKRSASQKSVDRFTIADNCEVITESELIVIYLCADNIDWNLVFRFSDGNLESDIIKSAMLITENTPTEVVKRVIDDLAVCVRNGNCDLPIKHFKWVCFR